MKIIIIFVLVFAVIAIIGFFIWAFYGQQSSPSEQQSTGALPEVSSNTSRHLPSSYSIKDTFPADATIKIGTAAGVIETKNFYKTVVDTEEGSIIIKQSDDYTISYNRQTSRFLLNVFASSSTEIINSAETDLLNILGIGQSDACKLSVSVLRPGQTNSTGLSFCAN